MKLITEFVLASKLQEIKQHRLGDTRMIEQLYTWTLCKRIQMSGSIGKCECDVKDVDIKDTKCGFGVTRSSYVLYTFFPFWYAVELLPQRLFLGEI